MSSHDLKSFRQKNQNNQKQEYKAHIYNADIASDYSVNIAVLTGFLYHYTKVNQSNNKNNHDDQTWVYQSLNGIVEYLGAYTIDQVRYLIKKAEAAGLIIKGNYNKTKYDRTTWYSLTNKALTYYNNVVDINTKCIPKSIWENSQMEAVNLPNGSGEIPTPIQDIKKDIKKECGENAVFTHTDSFSQKQNDEARKLFEERFKGRKISYEEMLERCEEHYREGKGLRKVTNKLWMDWIERERVDNYEMEQISQKISSPFTEEEEDMLNRYEVATKYGDRVDIFFPDAMKRNRVMTLVAKRDSLASKQSVMPKSAPQSLSALYQQIQQRNSLGASA